MPVPEPQDLVQPGGVPLRVPAADSPYWDFYAEVASAQLATWAAVRAGRILDVSGGHRWAQQLRAAGHAVLRVGADAVPGVQSVLADAHSLSWLADASLDGVVAESGALSECLAAEETVRDVARVLRPGGRLLLCVDSLLTGLARLADQGRWAELADVPSADCVLVADQDGTISRCFGPTELTELLGAGGLVVDWVRPRTALTPLAVERAVEQGGRGALTTLVRTELSLAPGKEGESLGMHLVASAHRPG